MNKAKDPAFLFYSKDFYEGTRTMLPEERACYVDLLIYQHQHGIIPNDLDRLLMYCSGVAKATLQATLQAKFKLTDKGYINERLNTTVIEREEYSKKQSKNGLVGVFFKKAKATLKASEYKDLKEFIYNDYTKEKLIEDLQKEKATHEGLLEGLLKHLAIANAIANENEDNNNTNKEIYSTISKALAMKLQEVLKRELPSTKGWDTHIRRMIELDNVPPARIKEVLQWHFKNYNRDYRIEILSAESFRKKFLKLEQQMEKALSEKKESTTSTPSILKQKIG